MDRRAFITGLSAPRGAPRRPGPARGEGLPIGFLSFQRSEGAAPPQAPPGLPAGFARAGIRGGRTSRYEFAGRRKRDRPRLVPSWSVCRSRDRHGGSTATRRQGGHLDDSDCHGPGSRSGWHRVCRQPGPARREHHGTVQSSAGPGRKAAGGSEGDPASARPRRHPRDRSVPGTPELERRNPPRVRSGCSFNTWRSWAPRTRDGVQRREQGAC